jgi:hypothetical protein
MYYPIRFQTGVKSTTVPNPAVRYAAANRAGTARTYQGPVDDYNFERQADNFRRLREVLQADCRDFQNVHAAHYRGDLHTNHRFVVTTNDDSLLWHKYVGFVAQSGQNHVFVAGRRIKVSRFLELQPHQQRVLLSGTEFIIKSVFDATHLKLLDEAGTLWN